MHPPRRWTERLLTLGLDLPLAPAPSARYLPAAETGGLVFTAGHLPVVAGVPSVTGLVGARVSTGQAAAAARLCVLNALAAVTTVVPLDRIRRIVKVTGFVASAPAFHEQDTVLDAASELLHDIFGDAGRHARSAIATAWLPLDAPVEIELIVALGPL